MAFRFGVGCDVCGFWVALFGVGLVARLTVVVYLCVVIGCLWVGLICGLAGYAVWMVWLFVQV